MTRSLPPNPSVRFLQEEAKDLLKACRRGDPQACAVLRNIHALAGKSDAQIRSANVGLQQTQFALAMEYGFATWEELKAEVVVRDDTGSKARVQREGDRAWIPDIPPRTGENSVLSCLTSCLKVLGESVTYEYLMGVGSHAFRIQFNWCPSAPHAFCGFNTAEPALRAFGYSLVQLPTNRPSHRDDLGFPTGLDVDKAMSAVRATIDRGVPGLMDWEESAILAGYEPPADGRTGLINAKGESVDKMPWSVGILTRAGSKPARATSVLWSLRQAVAHAHSPTSSGPSSDEQTIMSYPGGLAAWQKWIGQLRPGYVFPGGATGKDEPARIEEMPKDAWFGVALGNAWTLRSLVDARQAAGTYLRAVRSDLPPGSAAHLVGAAEQYDQTARGLERAMKHAVWPWEDDARQRWTANERTSQYEAMADAFEREKQAIACIEAALAALG